MISYGRSRPFTLNPRRDNMIDRYWTPEMKRIWSTQEEKFSAWRRVEIAALHAREGLGRIPAGTAHASDEQTWVDHLVTTAIERRDKLIKHDLNAFVEIMRLQLLHPRETVEQILHLEDDKAFNEAVTQHLKQRATNDLASLFHDGMTSYDTEEPAMSLLLIESSEQIKTSLHELCVTIYALAKKHKDDLMIGRTHGQHAQPITFGIKLLVWLETLNEGALELQRMQEHVSVMKLSGAVGTYGTLGPDVEAAVGERLGLQPVIATQIISLDRRARLVHELAIIGSNIQKIAFDLWTMAQTEISEIREPFGKMQKGSSAMPHKKNPITLEKIQGMARLLRGYATALTENIATSHERDISHSSVERIAVPDAFATLHHMIVELNRIMGGMEVFTKRMLKNLNMTNGVIASQRIEMILKQHGMPAETAYRTVQEMCAHAIREDEPLQQILKGDAEVTKVMGEHMDRLLAVFDWKTWVEQMDTLYERHHLLPS
jgi:adenylosuccinate lyase